MHGPAPFHLPSPSSDQEPSLGITYQARNARIASTMMTIAEYLMAAYPVRLPRSGSTGTGSTGMCSCVCGKRSLISFDLLRGGAAGAAGALLIPAAPDRETTRS